ncbi:MAG: hypothetical protein WCV93_02625 [Candidatus Shapirobacteria bacterium]|jgi:hypothetical protein
MDIRKITLFVLVIFSGLALSGCGPAKKIETTITPTPIPRVVEMPAEDRPHISLIPRVDGHELKLKIDKIPSYVSQIEYELLYTATDEGNEIEKGVGDTIKVTGNNLERDLLLGTASCTNGCKYKYDANINGGTLTLTFINQNSQVSTYQTPFRFVSGSELKKTKLLDLPTENFSISLNNPASEFFILLKNYRPGFSVFSSGSGKGKVISITPSTFTKTDLNLISGEYLGP